MKRKVRDCVLWLRVAAPAWWVVGVILTAWMTLNVAAVLERAWLRRLFPADFEIDEQLLSIPLLAPFVMGVCAVVLGFARAIRFHPLFKPDYRRWLRMTPWSAPKPLPLGPLALVPQDLVWVGGFLAMAWQIADAAVFAALVFLWSYLAVMAGTFLATGVKHLGFLLAFLIGGLVWGCLLSPIVMLVLTGLCDVLIRRGLALSLCQFPWDQIPDEQQLVFVQDGVVRNPEPFGSEKPQVRTLMDLGWPHFPLGPKCSSFDFSRRDGALLSLLIGFLTLVSCHLFKHMPHSSGDPREDMSAAVIFLCYLLVVPVFFELSEVARSPISLLGRIATRRVLIPAFDIQRIPTASAACVLLGLWMLKPLLALPDYVFVAVTTFGVLFCLLVLRPDRRRWRLTAPARIAPQTFQKNAKKLVEL